MIGRRQERDIGENSGQYRYCGQLVIVRCLVCGACRRGGGIFDQGFVDCRIESVYFVSFSVSPLGDDILCELVISAREIFGVCLSSRALVVSGDGEGRVCVATRECYGLIRERIQLSNFFTGELPGAKGRGTERVGCISVH